MTFDVGLHMYGEMHRCSSINSLVSFSQTRKIDVFFPVCLVEILRGGLRLGHSTTVGLLRAWYKNIRLIIAK